MDKFLRVDVGRLAAAEEPVAEKYRKVGGRSLIAKLLLDEVRPTCEPLGKHNKLILATGLLAGAGISSASRISMGGKSPLTGGIKESNSGGVSVDQLARLGIKAVIIEGDPKDWQLLRITSEGCSFLPAAEYLGMGTYALIETLKDEYRFNELAGFSRAHHRMPEAFTERELPDHKSVFDVSEEDIDRLLLY